jgi:apolipoprotein N-acyltransferase
VTTRFLIARSIEAPGLLLSGGLRIERESDGTPISARNALFVVDADGKVQASYDKAHLVPFGEYLPFRPLLERLGLARLAPGAIDFAAGPGPRTLLLPNQPSVGPLICYEAIFPGAVTDSRTRPQWLLNISNDAWFGRSSGPFQHFALARMRAIEEGLPVVRSTPNGVSGVIDSYGRVTARLGLGRKGVLVANLPRPRPGTPYGVYGDLGFLALCFLFITLGWHGNRTKQDCK